MKNKQSFSPSKIFLSTLALFLVLGIFTSITQIFAQDGINDENATSPGTGAIVSNTPASATTNDGINLLWLLPLIAIPFLAYILWPKHRQGDAIEEPYGESYAGAKGGRAKSEQFYDEDKNEVVTRENSRYRDEL